MGNEWMGDMKWASTAPGEAYSGGVIACPTADSDRHSPNLMICCCGFPLHSNNC